MLILLQGFASGRTLMLVIQKLGNFLFNQPNEEQRLVDFFTLGLDYQAQNNNKSQQTEQALTAVLKRSGQKAPIITLQGGGGVLQDRGQLHTAGLQGNTPGSSA
ncbi:hypothetical protein NQZ68_016795 [Dissostichus eleginoides]|nr:hypothetical protein NQZ68_016795 [Dissostichus eleginoides]